MLEPRRWHRTVIWIGIAQAGLSAASITWAADDARFARWGLADSWNLQLALLTFVSVFLAFFAYAADNRRVLIGEPVALIEMETGDWLVRFFHLDLGVIDPATRTLRAPTRKPRKPLRRRSRRRRPVDLMDNASALPTTPQLQQPQT